MLIQKKEIKYILVVLLLVIISVIGRVETLGKESHLAINKTTQEKNTNNKSTLNCDDSSDTISALIQQPKSGNSCLNIGCGSLF